ncbi:MAG: hypothetical protein Q4C64_04790 [Erysipelotrichia bacterium]|nr:hypothetical protein [Erysipelotrichia bacterium]
MIKLSKESIFYSAQIVIKHFKSEYEVIDEIVRIFNFKHMLMVIDSVTKDSPIYELIDEHELLHKEKNIATDDEEIAVVIPNYLIDKVLKIVIDTDDFPEYIFIYELTNLDNGLLCDNCSYKDLLFERIISVYIEIALDEDEMTVFLNKNLIDIDEVYGKIKLYIKNKNNKEYQNIKRIIKNKIFGRKNRS